MCCFVFNQPCFRWSRPAGPSWKTRRECMSEYCKLREQVRDGTCNWCLFVQHGVFFFLLLCLSNALEHKAVTPFRFSGSKARLAAHQWKLARFSKILTQTPPQSAQDTQTDRRRCTLSFFVCFCYFAISLTCFNLMLTRLSSGCSWTWSWFSNFQSEWSILSFA